MENKIMEDMELHGSGLIKKFSQLGLSVPQLSRLDLPMHCGIQKQKFELHFSGL